MNVLNYMHIHIHYTTYIFNNTLIITRKGKTVII